MTSTVKRSVPPPALVKMGNPLVRMLLGSPLHRVLDQSFLVLHLTGRKTGRRPSPVDAAFLLGRYGSEFGITDIPAVVQRLVFPLVRGAGRAGGRYRRFGAAPPPVAG
jgi:hypothetical protein